MKLSHGYDRVDLIFDRYFDASLKAGTRNDRGTGSMFVFEGDDTPNDMEQTFMKESRNKNELNEYSWRRNLLRSIKDRNCKLLP